MNAEVKEVWVDALRSGKYQQGRGRLKYEKSYCCLGVLCDLYLKQTGNIGWTKAESHVYSFGGARTYPPEIVSDWAQVAEQHTTLLATKNDNGHSFEEIAEYIEENL